MPVAAKEHPRGIARSREIGGAGHGCGPREKYLGAPGSFPESRQPGNKPEGAKKPDNCTERERLRAAMRQSVDRVNHTLLKPVSQITRAEIDEVMGHDGYWPRDGDARAEAFQDKTRDFFETFFERGSTRTPTRPSAR
jgi:hypothetical protein